MRKVFLDDLPRWESGGHRGKINWKESVGYKIKFIYNSIEGEVELITNKDNDFISIKYKNVIFDINKESFKKCKFGNLLKVVTKDFKIEIGQTIKEKNIDLTIIDREYRECKGKPDKKGRVYTKNEKWYLYHCNKCGYNGWKIESALLCNTGCSCCANQVVVKGVNDIATTNPELVKYFKGGIEEAQKYTKGSGKKVEVICDICGNTRFVVVSTIKENLVCENCKHIAISRSKEICKIEDSFEMNDQYNRLKYWDYDKNVKLPHEIHKGSSEKFWFICENDHSFQANLSHVNGKKATWCPHCANLLNESKMASVLKQVIKKEFPNSVWEYDIGFKGQKGGTSKYDIYVPEVNLIIECQSEYHDNKCNLDRLKREFAIKKGYYYIDIDYRDFDILQAIQLFFPFIKQIPDYVIHTKNVRVDWDMKEAQKLLNETELSQKEVAETVGAGIKSFYDKVNRNILEVPESKRKNKPVVQLTLKGDLVRKSSKARDFEKYGFRMPDICSCCKGRQKTHRGFLFMYESEYDKIKNDDGSIALKEDYQKISKNANKKEVFQFDLKGCLIGKYNSLTDVERKTGFLASNISACCNGVSKTSNGYIWIYKSDYEDNRDCIDDIIKSAKPKMFKKSVVCIDVNDFTYKIYDSAREAQKYTGIDYKTISYKCRKKYNNSDECIWIFQDDYNMLLKNNKTINIEIIDKFKKYKYKL